MMRQQSLRLSGTYPVKNQAGVSGFLTVGPSEDPGPYRSNSLKLAKPPSTVSTDPTVDRASGCAR